MKTSFDSAMQKEKMAVIALVIIIVCAISVFLVLEYGSDIFKNLTGQKDTIELGDCVDVNYIGKYSNSTIFDSSYEDATNKTGGIPLNIFVSFNSTEMPPSGYENYSQFGIIQGFMEGLIGLKEGDVETIGPIPPEKAYGVKPKIGDVIDLTYFAGTQYILKVINIEENVSMPSEFEMGNGTTTMYTLREDWHYVGERINSSYSFWENSSVVTKTNETLMWMYITPSTVVGENFTYGLADEITGTITTFPENTSRIVFINDTVIEVTNNPEINSTIETVIYYQGSYYPVASYTVESVTDDKINVSTTGSDGNKTFDEFDRTITIQRNVTQNISYPPFPGELLEQQLFYSLRYSDNNFKLSYLAMSGKTLYFDVVIEKVYKIS